MLDIKRKIIIAVYAVLFLGFVVFALASNVSDVIQRLIPVYMGIVIAAIPVFLEMIYPKADILFFIKHLVAILVLFVIASVVPPTVSGIINYKKIVYFSLLVAFTVLFFFDLFVYIKRDKARR
ncbi:MAG: hypothetical protein LBR37_02595 [Erysipelotrichaceae bacterium]|jgi:O-antigen ligase|nr:hypothetical protein [Erysipelotrichaceae bacterium]